MPNPTKARIVFYKVIQGTRYLLPPLSAYNCMFSTIEFTIEIGDKRYENLRVQIAQPYATNFEEPALETGPILDQAGTVIDFGELRINPDQFVDLCEQVYRDCIRHTFGAIKVAKPGVELSGSVYNFRREAEIDLQPDHAGG